ncbi:hypothetical protein [Rhizobium oryziradicis]|nr:hypothetical protein [Rhizobium oryziradicis]
MEDDTNWKSSYEKYNHVTVDVIGWRDEQTQSALVFWVATGLNPARVCSYSLTNKSNLLNDLKIELGKPKSEDLNEVSETAYWNPPKSEIYFTKVGSASGFTLSDTD